MRRGDRLVHYAAGSAERFRDGRVPPPPDDRSLGELAFTTHPYIPAQFAWGAERIQDRLGCGRWCQSQGYAKSEGLMKKTQIVTVALAALVLSAALLPAPSVAAPKTRSL